MTRLLTPWCAVGGLVFLAACGSSSDAPKTVSTPRSRARLAKLGCGGGFFPALTTTTGSTTTTANFAYVANATTSTDCTTGSSAP